MKKIQIYECLNCKKITQKFTYTYKYKFCCHACCMAYNIKYKIGLCNPENQKIGHVNGLKIRAKPKKKSNCLQCEKEIIYKNCINKKFCSRSCSAKYYSLRGINWGNNCKLHRNTLSWKKMLSENGITSIRKIRGAKRKFIYEKIRFDSQSEKELGKIIINDFKIELIENKNIHVKIGQNKFIEVDFFINEKFIEYHPNLTFLNGKEYENNYFLNRRKILDENGYENNPLFVIKNIKEIYNIL